MGERKTLGQYESEASGEPIQIVGKPADVCPYCGAGMFVNGTRSGNVAKFQYVWCRNKKCGRKFKARQPQSYIVREIDKNDEPSISGRNAIAIHRESA